MWPTWNQFQFLLSALSTFLFWNQFCYSPLDFEFRISHFLAAFCGNFYNFWAFLAWVWLLSTCAESYMSSAIDDLENFARNFAWFKIFQWHLKMTKLIWRHWLSGEHIAFIQLWFSRALCLAMWLAFFLQNHCLQHPASGKSYRITYRYLFLTPCVRINLFFKCTNKYVLPVAGERHLVQCHLSSFPAKSRGPSQYKYVVLPV